jgi:hypothetical protein
MTEINHFKKITFFSGDVIMSGQLRWTTRISRKLVDDDLSSLTI